MIRVGDIVREHDPHGEFHDDIGIVLGLDNVGPSTLALIEWQKFSSGHSNEGMHTFRPCKLLHGWNFYVTSLELIRSANGKIPRSGVLVGKNQLSLL